MDYSLLVGVHNLDMAAKEREESVGGAEGSGLVQGPRRDKLVAHSTAMESIQCNSDPVDIPSELPSGGIPARNHKGERLLLFVGIIDILQSYRLVKKIEHTFKAMIHDGDTVSVHRPGFYAERFLNFMSEKIFKKIPSSLKHSPSKKNKSVKTKISSSGPSSGQDKGGQPPSQEGLSGVSTVRPDVVPDGGHGVWSSSSEVASISDIRLEPRHYTPDHMSTNSLGTPSRLSASHSGRTPTPTWTEGTPSYTESTYSGDAAFPTTPVRSLTASKDSMPDRILEEAEPSTSYHETEMTRL